MKICFGCKHRLPLFLFYRNRMKYSLKSDKGKVKKCRVCSIKELINNKAIYYDFKESKFTPSPEGWKLKLKKLIYMLYSREHFKE